MTATGAQCTEKAGRPNVTATRRRDPDVRGPDRIVDLGVHTLDVLAQPIQDGDARGGEQGDQQGVFDERGALLPAGELLDSGDVSGHVVFSCS